MLYQLSYSRETCRRFSAVNGRPSQGARGGSVGRLAVAPGVIKAG